MVCLLTTCIYVRRAKKYAQQNFWIFEIGDFNVSVLVHVHRGMSSKISTRTRQWTTMIELSSLSLSSFLLLVVVGPLPVSIYVNQDSLGAQQLQQWRKGCRWQSVILSRGSKACGASLMIQCANMMSSQCSRKISSLGTYSCGWEFWTFCWHAMCASNGGSALKTTLLVCESASTWWTWSWDASSTTPKHW